MISTFKKRWQLFSDSIDTADPNIYSQGQKFRFYLQFLIMRIFAGTYMIDYLQYKFYEKNRYGRKRFIEYQRLHKIMDIANAPEKNIIFDSKMLFNQRFSKFLGREWLSIKDSSYNEFLDFLKRNKRIFVKPEIGSFGDGVAIIEYDQDREYHDVYEKLIATESIVEGIVSQTKELAEFNESSLNTLRIVTLIDKTGKSRVMFALLRVGRKGKIADNFHHEGIAAKVDLETGIVNTTGINRNFTRYTIHPDSKKPIVGFEIPKWKELLDFAIELSRQVPETRYVGWDIAINEQGQPICIEGNRGADPDVTQVTDKEGKYYAIMELL